jgi:hypothetical protein
MLQLGRQSAENRIKILGILETLNNPKSPRHPPWIVFRIEIRHDKIIPLRAVIVKQDVFEDASDSANRLVIVVC